jgi:hypothetical protein
MDKVTLGRGGIIALGHGGADMLDEALVYRFRTLGNKTGWQIIHGGDADQLALLALAGDETVGGLDQTYANIIVSHPRIRMQIETTRVRNTSPLR